MSIWGADSGSVMTDSQGDYRINGLIDGMYKLRALPDTHEKSDVMEVAVAGSDRLAMNVNVRETQPTFSTHELLIEVPAGRIGDQDFVIENLMPQGFEFEILEYSKKSVVVISDGNQLDSLGPVLSRMGFDVDVYSQNEAFLQVDNSLETYIGGRFSGDAAVVLDADLLILDLTGRVGFGRVLSMQESDLFTEYLARGGKIIFTGANAISRPDNEELNVFFDGQSLDRSGAMSTSASPSMSLSVNRFVEIQPGELVSVNPQQYDIVDSEGDVLFVADNAEKIVRKTNPSSGGVSYLWNGNFENVDWISSGIWQDVLKNILLEELQADVAWLDASPQATTVTSGSIPVNVIAETAGLGIGTYQATLLVNGNYPGNDVNYVNVTLKVTPLNVIARSSSGVVDWLNRPLNGDGSLSSDFFQLINAGQNGIIDPPAATGAPSGDDFIVRTFIGSKDVGRFGVSFPLNVDEGRFSLEFAHNVDITTNPRNIFVRAWDGPSVAASVAYGDSSLYGLQITSGEVAEFGSWVVGTVPNYPGPNAKDTNQDSVPDGYYVSIGLDPRDPIAPLEASVVSECLIGSFGLNDGELNVPSRLFATDAFIFVLDTGNNRIQVFDVQSGSVFRANTIGGSGVAPGQFSLPYGMAKFPAEDKFAVMDTGNDRVQVFSFDPVTGSITYESEFGSRGAAPGQFRWCPRGCG